MGLWMTKKRRKRRNWDDEEKREIVAQTRLPGVSVSRVARRYDANANLVFKWRRDPRLAMADDRFEGGAAPEFLLDLAIHAALLAGTEDAPGVWRSPRALPAR